MRAEQFVAANKIEVQEVVPASQKLQAGDAKKILNSAKKLWVAKGKKVSSFAPGQKVSKEMVEAMLGPTGNLRAPTLIVGTNVIVGFNADLYEEIFN